MKQTPIAIVAAAFVTVSGFYILASVILPGGEDSQLPSDIDSDNASAGVESIPEPGAAALLRERRLRELECAPMEAHLQGLIANSQSCDVDSDCAILSLGCPFGCVGAYSKAAESQIIKEEKAYRSQCQSCVYVCPTPVFERRAECQNNKCQVIDRPAFRMPPSPSG